VQRICLAAVKSDTSTVSRGIASDKPEGYYGIGKNGRSPYLLVYPPGTGWPSYTHRHWVPFSSPPTTRRATVELCEWQHQFRGRIDYPSRRPHWRRTSLNIWLRQPFSTRSAPCINMYRVRAQRWAWDIPFIIHVKYLSVILDKSVPWRLHVEMTEAKAFRTFTRIFSLFRSEHLSTNIKLTLHKVLIKLVIFMLSLPGD
jgi:hypothetical protein